MDNPMESLKERMAILETEQKHMAGALDRLVDSVESLKKIAWMAIGVMALVQMAGQALFRR